MVQTDRGGEVTFHGPGQVVIYLLMDLRRNKPGGKLYARQFVTKIEQAIINVLAAYNLGGERIAGAPGIYIAGGPRKGAKIAALGLKVRGNGCTYHGVSLNVAMDLAPFSWINPCGYSGLATVDMRTMGVRRGAGRRAAAAGRRTGTPAGHAGPQPNRTTPTRPPTGKQPNDFRHRYRHRPRLQRQRQAKRRQQDLAHPDQDRADRSRSSA